jgi:protocatechuate 3,4-dioxygenase beta subunit
MTGLVAVLALTLAQAAGQPPRDRLATPPPAGGAIEGRVLDAQSQEPLRRAVVELSAAELPRPLTTRTGADGRYAFGDLPAGRYTVRVSKPRYLPLEYGQRRPFEPGRRILLEPRARLQDVDMLLPRAGVVAGRVLEPSGDPIERVWVQLFRVGYTDGQRRLVSAGRAVSNDIGEYRLSGLAPGEYYLFAREMAVPPGPYVHDTIGYANTFYPGVRTVEEAERLTVGLGQELLNMDVTMPVARAATLSGRVVRVDGTPVPSVRVSLLDGTYSGSAGNVSGGAPTDADGRFRIAGVGAGSYQLAADVRDGPAPGRGVLPVDVVGADQPGLTIVVGTGGTLSGRVVSSSDEPLPFPSGAVLVGARRSDGVRLMAGETMRVAGDWTLEGRGLLGPRLIRAARLPDGWWLKAVLRSDQDVTDMPIEFDHGIEVGGIAIVLDDKPTRVEGRVADASGAPVSDYTVIAFSPDKSRWGAETRFIQAGRPDHAGHFRLTGLPPGEYLIAAVDYVETGQWLDPTYLASLVRTAVRVTLAPGESVSIDLVSKTR